MTEVVEGTLLRRMRMWRTEKVVEGTVVGGEREESVLEAMEVAGER